MKMKFLMFEIGKRGHGQRCALKTMKHPWQIRYSKCGFVCFLPFVSAMRGEENIETRVEPLALIS